MSAEPDLPEPDLHVIFSPSAAGSLKQALKETGRSGRVICPFDDFSFGPIASDDAETRAEWVDDVLGYSNWREVTESNEPVVTTSLSSATAPIVWVSLNSTASYAGFLWWLSHMGGAPCSIIERDSLPTLPAADLIAFFDHQVPLTAPERERYLNIWRRLCSEDAALRIIENGKLVSKEIDAFDSALLKFAAPQWQKAARIVGAVLTEFWEAGVYQAGDLVLASRLFELANVGVLQLRGDTSRLIQCEVRLAADTGDSGADGRA